MKTHLSELKLPLDRMILMGTNPEILDVCNPEIFSLEPLIGDRQGEP